MRANLSLQTTFVAINIRKYRDREYSEAAKYHIFQDSIIIRASVSLAERNLARENAGSLNFDHKNEEFVVSSRSRYVPELILNERYHQGFVITKYI